MSHFYIGLAAGTILYVVVFEVLQREKTRRVHGLLQFAFIILGFVIMLLVEIYGKMRYVFKNNLTLYNLFNLKKRLAIIYCKVLYTRHYFLHSWTYS